MNEKKALIAGASGLVGKELLTYLLKQNRYEKVVSIVRKPLGINHPKLEEVIVDFDHLTYYKEFFAVTDVYCTLGTTIKKAKTKEAMRRIDVSYPVAMARLAKEMGAGQFLIVSSMNANPESSIWYSRMKGELEQELKSIGIHSLKIFRPSLLLGDRSEFRLGERVGAVISQALAFTFIGPLRKYKAIEGKTVARAMYKAAGERNNGIFIYPSDQIDTIAGCNED